MPRKQNGFTGKDSFAFTKKVNDKIDISKVKRVAGSYPTNRRFGTTVVRTPIDQFNINATWSKWRQGYEQFVKQRFVEYDIPDVEAEIFPSFEEVINVTFTATRFPTSNTDDATYYVIKREVEQHEPLLLELVRVGIVDGVDYTGVQAENNETWDIVEFNPDEPAVLKLIGETLTNKPHPDSDITPKEKYTSSIIKNIYTLDNRVPERYVKHRVMPAVYTGNSVPQKTTLTIRARDLFRSSDGVSSLEEIPEIEYQSFVGKQISILGARSYYQMPQAIGGPIESAYSYEEIDAERFKSTVNFRGSYGESPCQIMIFDAKPLTTDSGVIYSRDMLAFSGKANFGYGGEFVFEKRFYQKWFNVEFNSTVLKEIAELVAPLIPTAMTIRSITRNDVSIDYRADENIVIEVEPFTSQALYCKNPFVVSGLGALRSCYVMACGNNSYTQEINELEITEGQDGSGGSDVKIIDTKLNINLDPKMDESYVTFDYLWLGDRYACDCASYSSAIIRAPEAYYESGVRKANRQRRYPIPSAGSNKSLDIIDINNDLAGTFNTWRTYEDQQKFQCCKHTISAYFNAGIKVIEPNQIPIFKDREKYEAKLDEKYRTSTFSSESIKRSELSSTGFVWAAVQLLVQTTATIIATPPGQQLSNMLFKPIEFLYGFKRIRNLFKNSNVNSSASVFEARSDNVIEVQKIQ